MPARLSPLAAFATILACNLPIEDKAGCDDSLDCLDGRACVQGQCTDDACGRSCGALCEARSRCVSERSCEATCDLADGPLAAIAPAQCGAQYDHLREIECDVLACLEGCVATCDRAVECALLEDASMCTLQCQLDACPSAPESCSALQADVLRCWSNGEASGC